MSLTINVVISFFYWMYCISFHPYNSYNSRVTCWYKNYRSKISEGLPLNINTLKKRYFVTIRNSLTVFEPFGNPKRVSDTNKYPVFLECMVTLLAMSWVGVDGHGCRDRIYNEHPHSHSYPHMHTHTHALTRKYSHSQSP